MAFDIVYLMSSSTEREGEKPDTVDKLATCQTFTPSCSKLQGITSIINTNVYKLQAMLQGIHAGGSCIRVCNIASPIRTRYLVVMCLTHPTCIGF